MSRAGCKRGSHPDKLNNQHYKQFADASGLAGLKAKHLAARGTKNKGGRGARTGVAHGPRR